MNCVSCDIVYACTTFGLFVFFPWGVPQLFRSDWRQSRDHGLDYASSRENDNEPFDFPTVWSYPLVR